VPGGAGVTPAPPGCCGKDRVQRMHPCRGWDRNVNTPRGSSVETHQRILEAARGLFAQHGVAGVSVRDIASAAGVTHPLVHRYFGTKQQMVAEILRREMEIVGPVRGVGPAAPLAPSLESLRGAIDYVLQESRTTILLLLRAQMDGLGSESVQEEVASPLIILMGWLRRQETLLSEDELKMLAVGMGAAVFGYVAAAPWLLQEVGLQDRGDDANRAGFVDVLVQVMAAVTGLSAEGELGDRGAEGTGGE